MNGPGMLQDFINRSQKDDHGDFPSPAFFFFFNFSKMWSQLILECGCGSQTGVKLCKCFVGGYIFLKKNIRKCHMKSRFQLLLHHWKVCQHGAHTATWRRLLAGSALKWLLLDRTGSRVCHRLAQSLFCISWLYTFASPARSCKHYKFLTSDLTYELPEDK